MTDSRDAVKVEDNEPRSRFEAHTAAGLAELVYEPRDGRLHLLHTGVPAAAEGQGVGAALVRAALERARSRGERVVPHCSFARAYVERHPEHADLVDLPG